MLADILFLAGGLVLILVGANMLTDGSGAIARRMGISELVVGLTVVALGTSAPELAISVISAIKGSGEMAIGNVVGSNIFNICAIIGIVSLSRKVSPFGKTRQHVVVNETQKSMRTCVFMQKKVIVPVVRSMFVAAERVLWLCKFVIVRVIR